MTVRILTVDATLEHLHQLRAAGNFQEIARLALQGGGNYRRVMFSSRKRRAEFILTREEQIAVDQLGEGWLERQRQASLEGEINSLAKARIQLQNLREKGKTAELVGLILGGKSKYRRVAMGEKLPAGVEQFNLAPQEVKLLNQVEKKRQRRQQRADDEMRPHFLILSSCPYCKNFSVDLKKGGGDMPKLILFAEPGTPSPCPHLAFLCFVPHLVDYPDGLTSGDEGDAGGLGFLFWKHEALKHSADHLFRRCVFSKVVQAIDCGRGCSEDQSEQIHSFKHHLMDSSGEGLFSYLRGWTIFSKNLEMV